MRFNNTTFDHNGQPIPNSFHVPSNFAHLPYVPHPLQIAGIMPMIPTLGGVQIPLQGSNQAYQKKAQKTVK